MDDGGEESLVIRARGGERAAFEGLARAVGRRLYARFYLSSQNPARSEDLVQETLLRAWRHLPGLENPRLFRSWIESIARSIEIDAARHDLRRKRKIPAAAQSSHGKDSAMEEVPDPSPRPDELLETGERRQRVVEVLQQMPSEYREVLTLRYFTDADYATIATQLAISNGSLRGLLQRGMNMLRERMGEE